MLREDFFVDDYQPTKRLLNFRFVLRTMGELCMVLFPFLLLLFAQIRSAKTEAAA